MKTAGLCTSSPSSAKASSSPAGKHRRPGDHQHHQGDEEMQACFARLMQLVPTVAPNNGRMSKVQLLQHVIDYILDLEYTLDFRPSLAEGKEEPEGAEWATEEEEGAQGADSGGRGPGTPQPATTTTTSRPLPPPPVAVERKPLTENAQVNSGKGHHQSAQQTSYFERQPSITWS